MNREDIRTSLEKIRPVSDNETFNICASKKEISQASKLRSAVSSRWTQRKALLLLLITLLLLLITLLLLLLITLLLWSMDTEKPYSTAAAADYTKI